MWTWIVFVLLVVAALCSLVALNAVRSRRRRRQRYDEAAARWLKADSARRIEAMPPLLTAGEAHGPAWYLHGCALLRSYRTREAARAFGMAHHADCRLETAALLTFACLKAADGEDSDILDQIDTTWREMNQPDVLRRAEDHLMMNCLASTTRQPPPLSPLGRMAWLVVGPAIQSRLELGVASGGSRWGGLLTDSSVNES